MKYIEHAYELIINGCKKVGFRVGLEVIVVKPVKEYGTDEKIKSCRAIKQGKKDIFSGVLSCEIIKDSHYCHFSIVAGFKGRLKEFKKVIGGNIFGEVGSDSSLNKFGQISQVGNGVIVFERRMVKVSFFLNAFGWAFS